LLEYTIYGRRNDNATNQQYVSQSRRSINMIKGHV
jgi:hypothetical protein